MTSEPPERPSQIVVDVSPEIGTDVHARRQLMGKLRVLAGQGYKMILLNVAELTSIDSVLLGALVTAYISVLRSGGTLRLLNVSDKLRRLLTATKLDRFIQ